MKAEEFNELKELIEFLKDNKIGEFDLERGDLKVRIKFAQEGGADLAGLAQALRSQAAQVVPAAVVAAPAPQAVPAAPTSAAPAAQVDEDASLHIVKSPIVGTFYGSPSPGAAPFVSPGDHVEKGQVICIVEAMKLMNEIEADASGEIVRSLVTNGQAVEYGQPLFSIRTQ